MFVTVNSQVLAGELRLLNRIVPTKPAIAILSHALLRADGDTLSLYACDLELGLSASCPARVDQPGSAAIPVERFLAMVERFADGDVIIGVENEQVHVKCGAFTSRLQVLPVDDFPEEHQPEGIETTLDADDFRRMILRTRCAVMPSGPRYVLQGALLTLTGPAVAMAATDTKRVALATMSRTEGGDARVVIPMKALDALESQIAEGGDVKLTIGDKRLFFLIDGRLLTSRRTNSEFPSYERVIPRENDKVITVDRQMFALALERVVLVSEETKTVIFNVTPKSMELMASSVEVGFANEVLRVDYEGPPIKVAMNGKYVLDFLDAASGGIITMALKNTKTAALFADGDDYWMVVMLLRA